MDKYKSISAPNVKRAKVLPPLALRARVRVRAMMYEDEVPLFFRVTYFLSLIHGASLKI